MGSVNSQFILSMLVIALGYISKKFNILSEKDGEALAKVVFNFTLPALVISTFSTIKVDYSLILLPLISVVYGGLMTVLALFAFRKEASGNKGMLSMVLPGFNIGLFAYPLVEAIWGERGLTYFAMFDMGNAVIIFGVCYLLASYFSPDEADVDFKSILNRLARSIPLISYMTTLAVNLSGLHFPGIVIDISKILAKANMPLSLLLLGVYLSFSFEASYWRSMAKVLGIRYFTGVSVGLGLYLILPFDPLFRYTMLIAMILPIGMAVIPYSVQFDYDSKFVGTVTNITIVLSFLLMWLFVALISI